ncbi:hypothetical protein [Actibacterium sp. 188UL27-1]|uniref:hypothetical protein n=1 Tax=Actibacterium sp. 188UL27-1 TaxID=2786961 RepID=UPI0019575542|nr:hypothetical protein [Actibacterium sp. 188UL27-1]MBM7069670.1 hypothetical protein [Actibacterium sp. 188UL27-1]
MSAPDTNLEKQAERHGPSLFGMAAVVVFALLLLAGLTSWLAYNGNVPEQNGAMIDGRTGVTVSVD